MIYVNQPLQIEIDCTLDGLAMTGAQSATIAYRSPSKKEGSWPATVSNSKVLYKANSELNEVGPWKLQPIVTFNGGDSIPGNTVSLDIKPRFA